MTTRQEMITDNIATFWNVRDDYKTKSLDELKAIVSGDRLPFAVCAVNTTGDLNLGMMMRTASLLGAEKFIIYGVPKYDKRSTVGAQNYIDVVKVDAKVDQHSSEITYDKFHPTMVQYGYVPMFIETGGYNISALPGVLKSVTGLAIRKPCLVFGNEGQGLPEALMKGHMKFSIAQRGVLRSLNVSSAASIAMYEMMKYLLK